MRGWVDGSRLRSQLRFSKRRHGLAISSHWSTADLATNVASASVWQSPGTDNPNTHRSMKQPFDCREPAQHRR